MATATNFAGFYVLDSWEVGICRACPRMSLMWRLSERSKETHLCQRKKDFISLRLLLSMHQILPVKFTFVL